MSPELYFELEAQGCTALSDWSVLCAGLCVRTTSCVSTWSCSLPSTVGALQARCVATCRRQSGAGTSSACCTSTWTYETSACHCPAHCRYTRTRAHTHAHMHLTHSLTLTTTEKETAQYSSSL